MSEFTNRDFDIFVARVEAALAKRGVLEIIVPTGGILHEPSFEVPLHEHMALRIPGKMPLTVLTIERMIFSWRICEYTDPLFIGRAWWYDSFEEALTAVADFMSSPAGEPDNGWLRADDIFEGSSRTRRAHFEFGERVITVDHGE